MTVTAPWAAHPAPSAQPAAAAPPAAGAAPPAVSAVVCCYTEDRWDQVVAAVASLHAQTVPPLEVLLVVDHNPALAARARRALTDVRVLENEEAQGLSGGRNTALRAARAPAVAFLDDDAVAEPTWLERLAGHLADPEVVGAGGRVTPAWEAGRPAWLPPEFDWVLGCTYRGTPTELAPVRNPFGGAMVLRRLPALAAGGYRTDLGRVGRHPAGCEETELCLRLRAAVPGAVFLYDPSAEIHHHAPVARCRFGYFRRRCYAEGVSKALVDAVAGSGPALDTERAYVRRTLPRAVAAHLVAVLRGDVAGLARALAIVVGLTWTAAGFVAGRAALRRRPPDPRPAPPAAGAPGAVAGAVAAGPAAPPAFTPAWVGELALDHPVADDLVVPRRRADGRPYERAVLVATLHRRPLGQVEVPLTDGAIAAADLAAAVEAAVGAARRAHLAADAAAEAAAAAATGTAAGTDTATGTARAARPPCWVEGPDATLPMTSVVLCTRDRPDQARRAVLRLLELDHPATEVIVVDNAPATDATATALADLVAAGRVRYVREDVPGLASARNAGARAARGEVVAFTDDDIRVPRWWLRALAGGFARHPAVACVTGTVFPGLIETEADERFDQAVAAGTKWGLVPRRYGLDGHRTDSPLFPYQLGVYGGGGNAAFRRDVLLDAGGFDPALGAGTPTSGGEDLDAFLRVLTDGHQLAYEPSAFVWHLHVTDERAVRRQAFRYGVGLGGFLTKLALSPAHAPALARRAVPAVRYLLGPSSPKNAAKAPGYPRALTMAELAGIAWGPVAYARSRARHGRSGRRRRPPVTATPTRAAQAPQ